MRREAAAGPLVDYQKGQRVLTREGYAGTVQDVLEGPGDLSTIWVDLDNGMGGGEYAEGELQPLPQTSAQLAAVDHTAADDYEELGDILSRRLPPRLVTRANLGPSSSGQDVSNGLPRNSVEVGQSDADHVAQRLALYLPPKEPEDQRSSLTPLSEAQKAGYKDGFAHGKEGITRNPAQPEDADYMAGYDIGWSEGVTVFREPANSWDQDEMADDQIGGVISDPISPMYSSKQAGIGDTLDRFRERYLPAPLHRMPDGMFWPMIQTTPEYGLFGPREDHTFSAGDRVNVHSRGGAWGDEPEPGRVVSIEGDEAIITTDNSGAIKYTVPLDRLTPLVTATLKQGDHVVVEAGALWDLVKGDPKPTKFYQDINTGFSFDWCRFRRENHCWLPKDLNEEASKQAGYAVWNPEDRGVCPRIKWAAQQQCPTGQPGPHSGQGGFTDATVPWEEGGQRNGVPSGMYSAPGFAHASRQAGLGDTEHPVPGIVREYAMTPVDEEPYAAEMDDISRAYRDLPILDPAAAPLWAELGELCLRQAEVLKGMYRVERLDHVDPYQTAEEMYRDVDQGVYKVTSLHSHHPVWDVDTNVAFRIVHDLTGHATSHSDFSLKGEVIAYQNQCAQTPEHLWPVLFTEIVAQSAYANVHHLFGEQKVGLINLTQAEIDAHCNMIMDAQDAAYDALHFSAGIDPSTLGVNGVHASKQAAFEFTALWKDVRAKAKKIRSGGGVRIVAAQDNVIVGHVKGEHGIYETEIVREPGKYNAAAWHCGCKWSSYSWGRTGPWKRYEGRMCSHALALHYEIDARKMYGRTLTLDEKQPAWMDQKHVHRPGDWDKSKQRYTHKVATFHPQVDYADDVAPATLMAHAMLSEGARYAEVRRMLVTAGVEQPLAIIKQARNVSFKARVRGIIRNLLLKDDGHVYDAHTGEHVNHSDAKYPGYHPTIGLNPHDRGKVGKQAAFGDDPSYEFEPEVVWAGSSGLESQPSFRDAMEANPDAWSAIDKAFAITPVMEKNLQTDSDVVSLGWDDVTEAREDLGLSPLAARLGAYLTKADMVAAWLESPEAQSGMTAEQALAQIYHQQEPDLFPALAAKKKDDGPSVSGVVLKAADTGRILMLQRSIGDKKDPARGTWEFPGGHHEEGDTTSLHAGIREWQEEVGQTFPEGGVVHHVWHSPNGVYAGHLIVIPEEKSVALHEGRSEDNPDDPDGDNSEQVAWWEVDHAKKNPALRPEVKSGTPWNEIAKAGGTKQSSTGSLTKRADDDRCTACSGTGEQGTGHECYICDGSGQRSAEIEGRAAGVTNDNPENELPVGRDDSIGQKPKEGRKMTDDFSLFDEAMVQPSQQHTAVVHARPMDEWGIALGLSTTATQHDEPEPALPTTDGAEEDPDEVASRLASALSTQAYTREDFGRTVQQTYDAARAQSASTNVTCFRCGQPIEDGQDLEMVAGKGIAHKTCPSVKSSAAYLPVHETQQQKAARLVAYADAVARGETPPGPNPFEHIVAGQEDNELKAAAANHLATQGGLQTEALKTYTPAERQQIIAEGEGGDPATNLDRLDIKGTHYEALEAATANTTASQQMSATVNGGRVVPEDEDMFFLSGDPNLSDV